MPDPVPSGEREERLRELGERLVDAIHALDSYAASSQTAPLERSERADSAVTAWRDFLAASPSPPLPDLEKATEVLMLHYPTLLNGQTTFEAVVRAIVAALYDSHGAYRDG